MRNSLFGIFLKQANRGVALIEFALILPILLLLVFGGAEITRLVLFHQKIDNATSGVANVITQLDAETVPCGDLQWARNTLMVEAMRPFTFNDGGSIVISAVEGSYVNANNPNRDNEPLRQRVIWQWLPDSAASRIGTQSADANGSGWPEIFRRAPNNGGMVNGERVIAVESFYEYTPILPFLDELIGLETVSNVYKVSFFRSRFGKMGSMQSGC
jgi:hypothetical protein